MDDMSRDCQSHPCSLFYHDKYFFQNSLPKPQKGLQMNKKQVNRAAGLILLTSVFVILCVGMSGCKKKTNGEYVKTVNDFYNKLLTYDTNIKRIDPKDPEACEELLSLLDLMNKDFQDFAEVPVPDNVPEAREHAQNAAAFMTKAVSYYHNALEGEKADETALRTAELNYENAVTEIKNVGVALQNADR